MEEAASLAYAAAADLMVLVDGDGRVRSANPRDEEWLGEPIAANTPLVSLFRRDHAPIVERLLDNGWLGVADHVLCLASGRRVCVVAAPLGQGDGWCLGLRDVSSREYLGEVERDRHRLAAAAELAASVARELNDPISIVQGRLELIVELGGEVPQPMRRHLEVALEHARRIASTLRNLRLVGLAGLPRVERVHVAAVIDEARDLVGPRLRARDLIVEVPEDLVAGGERATYARVFSMLIGSVLDATRRSTPLVVRALASGSAVQVEVGAGLDRGGRVRSWSGDPPGGEGGLGLSIARTMVGSVGGSITVLRGSGGLGMQVRLPGPPPRRVRPRDTVENVMIVGDADLQHIFASLLAGEGYELLCFESGERALQALDAADLPCGLGAQLFLPGMSGLSLADEVERRHPELIGRVVLVSDSRYAEPTPAGRIMRPPLHRNEVLSAFGRRVRRTS